MRAARCVPVESHPGRRCARWLPLQCCLRDSLGFKREKGPVLVSVLDLNSVDHLTHKYRDGSCPKMLRRNIRLHYANFPQPREPPPHFMRRLSSNATSPASSNNKKFCHIPDRVIARHFRPSFDKGQPRQLAIHPDQERMSVGLRPIERKGPVAKSAILPYIQIAEFAKIVCVQLKQVRQDRLLLRRRRDNLEVRGCRFAMLGHSGYGFLAMVFSLNSAWHPDRPNMLLPTAGCA